MDRFSDTPIQGKLPACLPKPEMDTAQIPPVKLDTVPACLPPHLRNKPRLRRFEVPEYLLCKFGLVIAAGTLAKYATVGGGPAYNVSVRTPLYPVSSLDEWAEARLGKLRRSSSEVV